MIYQHGGFKKKKKTQFVVLTESEGLCLSSSKQSGYYIYRKLCVCTYAYMWRSEDNFGYHLQKHCLLIGVSYWPSVH